jgi:hypothetical protein
MSHWQRIGDTFPEEGVVVETKIDDGKGCRNEAKLKRHRGLWFFPDGSMYVYYTPTHWRPAPHEECKHQFLMRHEYHGEIWWQCEDGCDFVFRPAEAIAVEEPNRQQKRTVQPKPGEQTP